MATEGGLCVGRVESARVIEVIEVVSTTGLGNADSLVRNVVDWFLTDGTHIARRDPVLDGAVGSTGPSPTPARPLVPTSRLV